MSKLIEYGPDYWENYQRRAGTEIANKLNAGRVDFVAITLQNEVLDVGIGNGEFIQRRPNTFGYDVNQVAIKWLLENGKYRDRFSDFNAFTFWDVLEHIPEPAIISGIWAPVIGCLPASRLLMICAGSGNRSIISPASIFITSLLRALFSGWRNTPLTVACMSYFEIEAGQGGIQLVSRFA
jgi:hypothetical protein